MSADSSTEMVEQSMQIFGALPPESTPSFPKYTCSRSFAFGHDRKYDVAGSQVSELIDDLAALCRERLSLCTRTIPDTDTVAGLEQAFRHGHAHARFRSSRSSVHSSTSRNSPLKSCSRTKRRATGFSPSAAICAVAVVPQQLACPLCLSRLFKAHILWLRPVSRLPKGLRQKARGPDLGRMWAPDAGCRHDHDPCGRSPRPAAGPRSAAPCLS